MAKNLRLNTDGEVSLAYDITTFTPWHRTGTVLSDCRSSDEVIEKASLGFTVAKVPLRIDIGLDQVGEVIPGAFVVQASDTKAYLGVVGAKFTPLQNRVAFGLCDSLPDIEYVSAGALGVGERVWILMRPKKQAVIEIIKGDPIETYLLMSNSHDGNSSLECRSTSVTVCCQNTLDMATNESEPSMKLRHTASIEARAKLAMTIMQSHFEHQKDWVAAMKYLAKHPINDAMINAFEQAMFGELDKTPEGRGRTILNTKLEQFENLLVRGQGTEIPGRCGNAYGMLQAYTEWVDHLSQVKGTEDRTKSLVFANGAKLKRQALQNALVLVGRK